jgi:dTDP-L-rhamnose 4-epimerase
MPRVSQAAFALDDPGAVVHRMFSSGPGASGTIAAHADPQRPRPTVRVLVTGGAGFIGSHVVDLLLAEGHEVRVLDALLPLAHRVRPDYLHPAAEFRHGDVGDADATAAALAGVDAVCHQAAMVGLGVDIGDAPDYVRHNALATAVLLRAMARAGSAGRLVLASSMVVYGEGRYRCELHGPVAPRPRAVSDLRRGRFEPRCTACAGPLAPEAIDENARLDPRNVYAATKLHQEQLSAGAGREAGIEVVALRYHNVFGPRMPRDTPYAGVASIFRSALAAGRAPQVYEDGRQLRDFVHVRDVARANLAALTVRALPESFTALNVASGRPRTILEMAGALCDAYGDGTRRPEVTGAYRLGDVRHVFARTELATELLGFAVREPFAEAMTEFAGAPLRDAA